MMKKAVTAGKVFILMLAFLAAAFPFFWCLMLSFKNNAEIMSIPTTFFPDEWVVDGYRKVLTEAPFLKWLWNSIFSSVVTTAIVAFTSCLGGYIFGKFQFRGKNLLFVCVLVTMMVPFQVTMIPVYMICSKMHILNSMAALIVPYMVSGFGIFLCRQFVENIPNEVIEAARIDGAGEWRIFFGIIIHSIKPAVAALCIFIFMGRWNDYLWPLVALVDTEKMTLPLALNFFNSSLLTDYCTSMSASVLVMIPIILIYFVFQKQFVEGITMTGIK